MYEGACFDDEMQGSRFENPMIDHAGDAASRGIFGDDLLQGGWGGDVRIGVCGDDTLQGQGGADTLTGHQGADVFVFRTGQGSEVIADFNAGEDSLWNKTSAKWGALDRAA